MNLLKALKEKELDCAIFMSGEIVNPNLFYFTGYSGSGTLIINKDGKRELIVPERDKGIAKKINAEVVVSNNISDEINKRKLRKAGTDFENLATNIYFRIKGKLGCGIYDISDLMKGIRMIKNKAEIENIRRACNITGEIFNKLRKNFKKFRTESEAAAFLSYEARVMGCENAFEPIVASGKNAAVPHHSSNDKLREGFCVVDFGVKYKGYCSDITRTFFLGRITEKEKRIYNDFLKLQEKTIRKTLAGGNISELYNDVKGELGEKLIHSLGHGMGIEVHESPNISSNETGSFKEGMVVTIEPGIYIPGKYGIRIEDDILIKKNNYEILSKLSKELVVI